ncbi:MAG: NAD-dependent epimerase/dehydratase family protein [Pirellulales bacterium]
MKSVLITGGLGFVGTHLADNLIKSGCKLTIVDSLLTNVAQPSEYADRCKVICDSIENVAQDLAPGSGSGYQFDEIYHLASHVGPAGVLQHAGDIARSVILSGDVATTLALQHGSRLILASTSEVYGRSGKLSEDLDCIVHPDYTVRLEYAAAKLTSEIAALNKAKVTELHVNVVRPFNISGPRQLPDGGFVLPRFIVAALTNTPLTVFCDGKQTRAFTDVRDIVTGLIATMRGEARGQVLNLGNPANEVAILKLAQEVVRLTKSQSEIRLTDPKKLFGPLYEEGIERCPNVEKALRLLDWKPEYSLTKTIEDSIEYYRSRPDLVSINECEAVLSK